MNDNSFISFITDNIFWIIVVLEIIAVALALTIFIFPLSKTGNYSPEKARTINEAREKKRIALEMKAQGKERRRRKKRKDEYPENESSEIITDEAAADFGHNIEIEAENNITAKAVRKLSVIVCVNGSEEEAVEFLNEIYLQDYPDFEVILVFDVAAESSDYLAERIHIHHPSAHVTFIPPGSHNLSRRKLALTLGMKAAKGEIVLTTIANIRIPSRSWLSTMAEPFNRYPGIDIVLGFSRMNFSEMRGPARWYQNFDSTLTNSFWTGFAICGHPYRGDGFNLALRRDLFFEKKGYSRSIFLHTGDDDVFINQIANGLNTALVLDHDAVITTVWGDSADRIRALRKEQYSFTAHWLPRRPFVYAGLLTFMQWLALGLATGACLLTLADLPFIAVPLSILAGFWITESAIYRTTAFRLKAAHTWLAAPLFWLYRPIGNCFFRMNHRRNRIKNYTWQRGPVKTI